jgi:hypothetical protein
MHMPITQLWPIMQTLSQAPQCCGSPETSTHFITSAQHFWVPTQCGVPKHLHWPETQVSFEPHTMPQPPQFCVSVWPFLHELPQQISSLLQPPEPPQRQLPPWQVSFITHCLAQLPQCLGSFCRFAQAVIVVPAQHASPGAHTEAPHLHWPPRHASGGGLQLMPQPPQFASSVR